jgi:YjbE family integral membrane protein
MLSNPEILTALWQIVIVDVLLSGDNAVVIALACRNLPDEHRRTAVLAGTAGAVLVRVAFCFVISWLMQIPALRLVGGALLVWIGVKLMVPEDAGEGEGVHSAAHFWGAIRTIIVADVVMSLDNVIAIVAAAKGQLGLVIFGLMLSIPLIVFGSQLVLKVLNRYPLLVMAGAGLLGWLAGEIMVADPLVIEYAQQIGPWVGRAASVAGTLIVIGVGLALKRRAALLPRPLEDLRVEGPK